MKTTHLPNLTIIGAGSIGLLYFHLLKNTKIFNLSFCDTRIKYQKKFSTKFTIPYKNTILAKNSYFFAKITPKDKIIDTNIVLITVKAYQVKKICEEIKPYLPKKALVIIMCNGMGAQFEAKEILKNNKVFFATTSNGSTHIKYQVFHNGFGDTFLGINNHILPKILKILVKRLPRAFVTIDINKILYSKLAINAIINPLTVKYHCKNGELINYPDSIQQIAQEIAIIYKKLKINLTFDDIFNNALKVIQNTRNNYSSMYQDYAFKRKSEIDYILGFLIKKAELFNLEIPHIKELYNFLKGQE